MFYVILSVSIDIPYLAPPIINVLHSPSLQIFYSAHTTPYLNIPFFLLFGYNIKHTLYLKRKHTLNFFQQRINFGFSFYCFRLSMFFLSMFSRDTDMF